MRLEISDPEKTYLEQLLSNAYRGLMRELNRTDVLDYKSRVKEELEIADRLRAKLRSAAEEELFSSLADEVT